MILLAIFARATNWLNRNRMEQGCNFGSKDLWTLEQSPQIHSNPKFPWHCHLKIKQNDSLTHTLGPSLVLSVESESFQLMHFTAWRNRCKGDTQPGTHPFKGLSRLPPRFGRGDVLGMASRPLEESRVNQITRGVNGSDGDLVDQETLKKTIPKCSGKMFE